MKKYTSGLVALAFVFSPLLVSADVAPSTDPQTQYVQALQQVIELLIQQVQVLMQQLAVVQAQQATVNTKIDTIVQNTTPSPAPTPVFGSTNPAPSAIVPVMKDLTMTVTKDMLSGYPKSTGFPVYEISISYKENGQYPKGVPITLTSDDGGKFLSGNDNGGLASSPVIVLTNSYDSHYLANMSYRSVTTDTVTFTATANGATTTKSI